MAEHRKLLLRNSPKADESLLGFIVRLTELNDYDTPTWITQEAKLGNIWNQLAFVKNNIDIEPLAKLSGREVAELTPLLYLSADGSNKSLTPRVILNQTVPAYAIRLKDPKICPACLRESGYCRKVWDLAPLTSCPIHRCLLLAECPKCKRRISWIRNSISQCPHPCGYNWTDASLQFVDDVGLAISRQIHHLCGLPVGKAPHQEFIAGTPLTGLELEHLISSVAFIASQLDGFIDTKWKYFVSIRDNERIHNLLTKALLVFNNWPNNFFSFLDWRRLQTAKAQCSGFKNEFNEYRNALYQQLSSRHFDFLRNAFEEYLVAH